MIQDLIWSGCCLTVLRSLVTAMTTDIYMLQCGKRIKFGKVVMKCKGNYSPLSIG